MSMTWFLIVLSVLIAVPIVGFAVTIYKLMREIKK